MTFSSVSDKLCIFGGGNMAHAIISSLYTTKNQPMECITVIDPDQLKLRTMETSFGVKTFGNSGEQENPISIVEKESHPGYENS